MIKDGLLRHPPEWSGRGGGGHQEPINLDIRVDGYQHDMYELVRTQDPMCTNMDWMIANRLSLGMVDLA